MSSLIDKTCLLLPINSHHSPESSQSLSNEYSLVAKKPDLRVYPRGCRRQILIKETLPSNEYSLIAKKPALRVYPKGCGRQILTKEKDSNNGEAISNIANTIANGTKDQEENRLTLEKKLESSKHISYEKCMPTKLDNLIISDLIENKSSTLEFPSISKDFHALKQKNERLPNSAVFNRMEVEDKMLDCFEATSNKILVEFRNKAASKVNSIDNMVVSTSQENNHTIDQLAIIKPTKELYTKKKRKMDHRYEIVLVKKSKSNSLVCNNNNKDVSFSPKSDDFVAFNKVSYALKLFRIIHSRASSANSAYTKFVRKYCKFNQGTIGKIRGVEIGDEFYFRAEMNIIGLHCQLIAGVDYIKEHGRKIAISVVSSWSRYSDQRRGSDVLMYSGTGESFKKDQQFEGRNLALKNSIEDRIPIRVIYGHTLLGKKRYVYDGLYLAEGYTVEDSKLMFRLCRIPGQAEIDIGGLEMLRRPRLPNLPFTYMTKPIYPFSYTCN